MNKIKMALLKDKIDVLRKKAELEGRFSLFHFKLIYNKIVNAKDYQGMKQIYDIVSGWDNNCNISYDFGVELDKKIEQEDIILFVNRAKLDVDRNCSKIPESDKLINIMEKGLINYGHINAVGGSGIIDKPENLNLSLVDTPLVNLAGYIKLVAPYKNNDSMIIMEIPSHLVDEEGSIRKGVNACDIYNLDGTNPAIKPEFIKGVIFKKNNSLDEFYSRDEIIGSKNKTNGK